MMRFRRIKAMHIGLVGQHRKSRRDSYGRGHMTKAPLHILAAYLGRIMSLSAHKQGASLFGPLIASAYYVLESRFVVSDMVPSTHVLGPGAPCRATGA